jgi:hypothetical protein
MVASVARPRLEREQIQRGQFTAVPDDVLRAKSSHELRICREPILSELLKLAIGDEEVLTDHVREQHPRVETVKAKREKLPGRLLGSAMDCLPSMTARHGRTCRAFGVPQWALGSRLSYSRAT